MPLTFTLDDEAADQECTLICKISTDGKACSTYVWTKNIATYLSEICEALNTYVAQGYTLERIAVERSKA